ncbi:MAG: hypothetical protein QXO12_02315, partial [Candidatus Pacearchaeota archaeon]
GEKGMIESAKKAMEKCLEKGWPNYAGKIAIELAKLGEKGMIESAKKAMEKCLEKGWPNYAGKIAIELAKLGEKGMIESAKKAMEKCLEEDWPDYAGKIAIELAKLGEKGMIESAKKAMEKCLEKGWPNYAGKIAIELAKLGERPEKIEEVLSRKKIEEELYSYQIIADLLKTNQDLGQLFLEYLPQLEAFKEYCKKINQDLPQEKKIDDPEKFIEKYQSGIVKLHLLDLDLSNAFLSQILKNHGFPRLERYFENIVKDFNPKSLKEVLPKIKNLDPEYFSRLIEISSAYQRMGFEKDLEKILKENTQKEIESLELIKILGKNLLKKFSQKIGIKAKIQENAFDKWNLEYLPRLFTAEGQYNSEDKELLKLIMKVSFQEKSFLPSLFGKIEGEYDSDEKEYLKEIQEYNLKVKEEFEKNGLDFNQWLNYDKKLEFSVGQTKDQLEAKRKAFEKELISTVKELVGSYKEKKKGILSDQEAKDIFNKVFKKYGIQFKEEEIIHPQKGKLSLKDVELILKDFNSEIEKIYQEEKDKTKKENIATALSHLKDLEKRLPDLERELLRKGYELEIRVWQREPGYDIFQGNYTHCCVAVENFNRGAILDYLIDTNLQVVEIRDKIEDKTIAQTWLFLAKDNHNNLNLILDNVEINSDYSALEPQIRENLFKYIQEYAKAFGKDKIKRILLGGSSYNDVETKGLNSISLTLTKLAGSPRKTEYLDAFGSAWVDPSKETLKSFFVISEKEEREKSKYHSSSKKNF